MSTEMVMTRTGVLPRQIEEGEIVYPDSDGQPMAENDLQFEWITTLKWNLDDMLRENPNVYVAGDMLWYPVIRHPEIRMAPDVFVVFGRPKGYRGSYRQWEEGGIPLQVVFEVLSPGNRTGEMNRKRLFYERYGVEEYYLLDPEGKAMEGWLRSPLTDRLERIPPFTTFTSPRLQIRFGLSSNDLVVYRANGERFETYMEVFAQRRAAVVEQQEAIRQAEEARERARQEREQAEEARQQAEQERQRAERLAARLRELGIDPEEEQP